YHCLIPSQKSHNFIKPFSYKLDYLFQIQDRVKLLHYLEFDCNALYDILIKFFESDIVKVAKKQWTIAGQAVNVFRLYLDKKLYSLPDGDDVKEGNVDAFVRKAYFGGRTEIFKPLYNANDNDENDWLYCFDINSLYPHCMAKYSYPNKFDKWITELDYSRQSI